MRHIAVTRTDLGKNLPVNIHRHRAHTNHHAGNLFPKNHSPNIIISHGGPSASTISSSPLLLFSGTNNTGGANSQGPIDLNNGNRLVNQTQRHKMTLPTLAVANVPNLPTIPELPNNITRNTLQRKKKLGPSHVVNSKVEVAIGPQGCSYGAFECAV
jgi:hypothetical protein